MKVKCYYTISREAIIEVDDKYAYLGTEEWLESYPKRQQAYKDMDELWNYVNVELDNEENDKDICLNGIFDMEDNCLAEG